jgi:O-antigen/teichoic acid export membrane protein
MGLFERGSFTGPNSVEASVILVAYALGMLPAVFKFALDNIFISFNDRKTPLIASAAAILLNIGLDFLLIIPLKLFGIAFASAVSYTAAATIMTIKLKKKLGEDDMIITAVKNMLRVLLSVVPISIITLIVFSAIFYSMKSTLVHIILCMAFAAVVFVLGYKFALKRICGDVCLKINIRGLREKKIIYYPSPVTASGIENGYEIICDAQYNENEIFKLDIMNLKYIKQVLNSEFAQKLIKNTNKLFTESLPEYFAKAKTALFKKVKSIIKFIKDKKNKPEKNNNKVN